MQQVLGSMYQALRGVASAPGFSMVYTLPVMKTSANLDLTDISHVFASLLELVGTYLCLSTDLDCTRLHVHVCNADSLVSTASCSAFPNSKAEILPKDIFLLQQGRRSGSAFSVQFDLGFLTAELTDILLYGNNADTSIYQQLPNTARTFSPEQRGLSLVPAYLRAGQVLFLAPTSATDKYNTCFMRPRLSDSAFSSLGHDVISSNSAPGDMIPILAGVEVITLRQLKAFWLSSPGISSELPPVAAMCRTPSAKVRDFS